MSSFRTPPEGVEVRRHQNTTSHRELPPPSFIADLLNSSSILDPPPASNMANLPRPDSPRRSPLPDPTTLTRTLSRPGSDPLLPHPDTFSSLPNHLSSLQIAAEVARFEYFRDHPRPRPVGDPESGLGTDEGRRPSRLQQGETPGERAWYASGWLASSLEQPDSEEAQVRTHADAWDRLVADLGSSSPSSLYPSYASPFASSFAHVYHRLQPHPIMARRYPGPAGEWLRAELERRSAPQAGRREGTDRNRRWMSGWGAGTTFDQNLAEFDLRSSERQAETDRPGLGLSDSTRLTDADAQRRATLVRLLPRVRLSADNSITAPDDMMNLSDTSSESSSNDLPTPTGDYSRGNNRDEEDMVLEGSYLLNARRRLLGTARALQREEQGAGREWSVVSHRRSGRRPLSSDTSSASTLTGTVTPQASREPVRPSGAFARAFPLSSQAERRPSSSGTLSSTAPSSSVARPALHANATVPPPPLPGQPIPVYAPSGLRHRPLSPRPSDPSSTTAATATPPVPRMIPRDPVAGREQPARSFSGLLAHLDAWSGSPEAMETDDDHSGRGSRSVDGNADDDAGATGGDNFGFGGPRRSRLLAMRPLDRQNPSNADDHSTAGGRTELRVGVGQARSTRRRDVWQGASEADREAEQARRNRNRNSVVTTREDGEWTVVGSEAADARRTPSFTINPPAASASENAAVQEATAELASTLRTLRDTFTSWDDERLRPGRFNDSTELLIRALAHLDSPSPPADAGEDENARHQTVDNGRLRELRVPRRQASLSQSELESFQRSSDRSVSFTDQQRPSQSYSRGDGDGHAAAAGGVRMQALGSGESIGTGANLVRRRSMRESLVPSGLSIRRQRHAALGEHRMGTAAWGDDDMSVVATAGSEETRDRRMEVEDSGAQSDDDKDNSASSSAVDGPSSRPLHSLPSRHTLASRSNLRRAGRAGTGTDTGASVRGSAASRRERPPLRAVYPPQPRLPSTLSTATYPLRFELVESNDDDPVLSTAVNSGAEDEHENGNENDDRDPPTPTAASSARDILGSGTSVGSLHRRSSVLSGQSGTAFSRGQLSPARAARAIRGLRVRRSSVGDARNVFRNDESIYRTRRGRNVDLVMRFLVAVPPHSSSTSSSSALAAVANSSQPPSVSTATAEHNEAEGERVAGLSRRGLEGSHTESGLQTARLGDVEDVGMANVDASQPAHAEELEQEEVEDRGPIFTLTRMVLKVPARRGAAAVSEGMVFISFDPICPEDLAYYNDFTASDVQDLVDRTGIVGPGLAPSARTAPHQVESGGNRRQREEVEGKEEFEQEGDADRGTFKRRRLNGYGSNGLGTDADSEAGDADARFDPATVSPSFAALRVSSPAIAPNPPRPPILPAAFFSFPPSTYQTELNFLDQPQRGLGGRYVAVKLLRARRDPEALVTLSRLTGAARTEPDRSSRSRPGGAAGGARPTNGGEEGVEDAELYYDDMEVQWVGLMGYTGRRSFQSSGELI